jgi:hypothetical protein
MAALQQRAGLWRQGIRYVKSAAFGAALSALFKDVVNDFPACIEGVVYHFTAAADNIVDALTHTAHNIV